MPTDAEYMREYRRRRALNDGKPLTSRDMELQAAYDRIAELERDLERMALDLDAANRTIREQGPLPF